MLSRGLLFFRLSPSTLCGGAGRGADAGPRGVGELLPLPGPGESKEELEVRLRLKGESPTPPRRKETVAGGNLPRWFGGDLITGLEQASFAGEVVHRRWGQHIIATGAIVAGHKVQLSGGLWRLSPLASLCQVVRRGCSIDLSGLRSCLPPHRIMGRCYGELAPCTGSACLQYGPCLQA